MARSNIDGARIATCLLMDKNRLGLTVVPSSGQAVQIAAGDPPLVLVNASAAAAVKLPAAAVAEKGAFFLIGATGAGTLTLQTSSGGALPIAATVTTNRLELVVSDGALWRGVLSGSS